MALSDDLTSQPTADEPKYVPKTSFDGVKGTIDTGPVSEPPASHKELLEKFGYDPDEVEIVGNIGRSSWQAFNGEFLHSYRYNIATRSPSGANVDELLDTIKAREPSPKMDRGKHWFHFQAGDVHAGKGPDDGGGIEAIIDKYMDSVDKAVAEFDLMRPLGIAGINIPFVGDMVEGVVSQNGKNLAGNDLLPGEQLRVARRLMLATVDAFLDFGVPIQVEAIGGNHDEFTRQQSMPAGDNMAVEAAIAVSDAMKLSSAYDGVSVQVPPRYQGHMTVDVGGTTCVYVHGHKFGSGASVEKKIESWWSGQSLHGHPAGSAHLLAAGHFHSFRVLQISAMKTAVMSPSFEVCSRWFQESNGTTAKRGAAIYLTREGDCSRFSVV